MVETEIEVNTKNLHLVMQMPLVTNEDGWIIHAEDIKEIYIEDRRKKKTTKFIRSD